MFRMVNVSCFVVFLLLFPAIVYTQSLTLDTLKIQKESKRAPRKYQGSPDDIASYICRNYTDESIKSYAISYWITQNIRYDLKAFLGKRNYALTSNEVLKKKKAICGEYAQLYKEMCESVGMKAEIISGYTRPWDFLPRDTFYRAEHAWTMAEINGRHELMDLTWAAGHIKNRNRVISGVAFKFLKIPYKNRVKWVKSFDSFWLNTEPIEMVLTHLPVAPPFQLLSTAVSIDSFAAGPDAIDHELMFRSIARQDGYRLKAILTKEYIDQQIELGDQSREFNPNNHRIQAIHYLSAVDSLYRRGYAGENKPLKLSDRDLNRIDDYCSITDSLFRISYKENKEEQIYYARKSNKWKQELKKRNSHYQGVARKRTGLNKKQISIIDKHNRSNKAILKKLSLQSSTTKFKKLSMIDRPSSKEKEKPLLARENLNLSDSLLASADSILDKVEVILSVVSPMEINDVLYAEIEAEDLHKANYKDLNNWVRYKSGKLPWIYTDRKIIEKKWFEKLYLQADSINKQSADSLLGNLYSNQKESAVLMKDYHRKMKIAIKAIQKVKKASFVDQDEELLYRERMFRLKEQRRNFAVETKARRINKKLKKQLRLESKFLNKSIDKFKKDSKLESNRHKMYSNYRKEIKTAEDERIKQVLNNLKVYRKYIDKTIKNNGKIN